MRDDEPRDRLMEMAAVRGRLVEDGVLEYGESAEQRLEIELRFTERFAGK